MDNTDKDLASRSLITSLEDLESRWRKKLETLEAREDELRQDLIEVKKNKEKTELTVTRILQTISIVKKTLSYLSDD